MDKELSLLILDEGLSGVRPLLFHLCSTVEDGRSPGDLDLDPRNEPSAAERLGERSLLILKGGSSPGDLDLVLDLLARL